jgi:transcriptional regulator with XRE-family HTH domain
MGAVTKFADIDYERFIRTYLERIARNLLNLRGKMSQQEFAKRAGVSRTTIQRMENGEDFKITNFLRIAATFGVLPTDLCLTEAERAEAQVKMKMFRDALKDELKREILADLRGSGKK